MFKIKNLVTGRIVKECCSRQVITFDSKDDAERFASSMQMNAIADRKHTKFVVINA